MTTKNKNMVHFFGTPFSISEYLKTLASILVPGKLVGFASATFLLCLPTKPVCLLTHQAHLLSVLDWQTCLSFSHRLVFVSSHRLETKFDMCGKQIRICEGDKHGCVWETNVDLCGRQRKFLWEKGAVALLVNTPSPLLWGVEENPDWKN